MSKSKKRDEFSASVRRVLRERVGGLCSNPDCPQRTLGPKFSDKNKSQKRGQAAHIHAAAPGGPRYVPDMAQSERKSIDNAIWLCIACADKIDTDEKKYPADLLKAWKRKTEAHVAFLLDNPPPNHDAILSSVAMLIGSSNDTHHLDIPGMVKKLYEEKLEALDPRWKVQLDLIGCGQRYTLEPSNSPIGMILKYKSNNPQLIVATNDLMRRIYDYGGVCEIKDGEFALEGSPLFDFLLSGSSLQRVVMRNEKIVPCRVEILDDANISTIFGFDAKGILSHGERGIKFSILAWDGILSIHCILDYEKGNSLKECDTVSFPCKINFNIKNWDEIDIRNIPYFFEVFHFCNIVDKNKRMRIASKIDESPKMPTFHLDMGITHDEHFLALLAYVDNARTLANYLNVELPLKLGIGFSGDEFYELKVLAEMINKGFTEYKFSETDSSISVIFDAIEENIALLMENKSDSQDISITFEETTNQVITVFDRELILPPKMREFTKVVPKIQPVPNNTNIDKKLKVEFLPSEGCKIKVYFANSLPKASPHP